MSFCLFRGLLSHSHLGRIYVCLYIRQVSPSLDGSSSSTSSTGESTGRHLGRRPGGPFALRRHRSRTGARRRRGRQRPEMSLSWPWPYSRTRLRRLGRGSNTDAAAKGTAIMDGPCMEAHHHCGRGGGRHMCKAVSWARKEGRKEDGRTEHMPVCTYELKALRHHQCARLIDSAAFESLSYVHTTRNTYIGTSS